MHDADVRAALMRDLRRRHRDARTLIVEELGLCQGEARVDVAVIDEAITGFEIKSDADTLGRLGRQLATYNRILDYAYLVAGERHIEKATEALPEWWGVTCVRRQRGRAVMHPVRAASPNPAVDVRACVELLWRDEAFAELDSRGLASGLSRAPRAALWDALVEQVDEDELRNIVRERLRSRCAWRRPAEPAEEPATPWWAEFVVAPAAAAASA